MPNNLKVDEEVVIYSTLDGNPYVGVPPILPTILPVNLIDRASGVQPPRFIFQRVGVDTYLLTINGLQVVELDGRLFAVVEGAAQEWVVTYRSNHDAYTITKRLDSPEEIGWIAPTEGENRQIRVGPLIVGRSFPPFYPPTELFKFEFPNE